MSTINWRIASRLHVRALAVIAVTALGASLTAGAAPSQQVTRNVDVGGPAAKVAAVLAAEAAATASPAIAQGKVLSLAEAETAGFEPFTASDLQDAYKLPSALLGSRQVVAIVSAFDYPTAESDFAEYRAANNLPPCSEDFPCFQKLNQEGAPTPLPQPVATWASASAIGLQTAAAACPNCRLLLVEADDETLAGLHAAVDTAVEAGADVVVSMFLHQEDGTFNDRAGHFDHPDVTFVAPAGHDRFGNGVGRQHLPAAYPTVIAVGGTTLSRDTSARGWRETGWSMTSSGCSAYVTKPRWQRTGACGRKRTVADVAAVADPGTPVAIYNTFPHAGWIAVGGSGIAAGFIGGVYGLSGRSGFREAGARLYRNHRDLFDVTAGSNGTCGGSYLCVADHGYDGLTGLGTPDGIGAF